MQNYFVLFDIPISFVVDLDKLAVSFRGLQQRVHPDKFVTSTAQERRLSMQQSARINDAYQVLKSPLKRAQYLLELNKFFTKDEETTMDNAFLMEQMELRETLEGISHKENPGAALNVFINKIDDLEKGIVDKLTTQFENLTQDSLQQINETVKKLQFINKLKEETIELEDELY